MVKTRTQLARAAASTVTATNVAAGGSTAPNAAARGAGTSGARGSSWPRASTRPTIAAMTPRGSGGSSESSDSDYSPSSSSGDDGDSDTSDDDDGDGRTPGWIAAAIAAGWAPTANAPTTPTAAPTTTRRGSGLGVTRYTGTTGASTGSSAREPMALVAQKRRLLRDMEMPDYTPSPDMPVETWIGAIEGVLEELEEIARDGGPTFRPRQLFNAIGSKIRTPSGIRWFNNLRATLPDGDKTPWNLFDKLRERFGRPDNDVRVRIRLSQRRWQPGERYHDYAGQLRRIAEGSGVEDAEIMDYFLEGIDVATRNFVKLRAPQTLSDAARLATEYGVEEWNVAHGMQLLGREWPTPSHPEPLIAAAASAAVGITMPTPDGTGSIVGVAPGALPTASLFGPGPTDPVLSNPNGVYNYWTGRYERPPNRVFRSGQWVLNGGTRPDQVVAQRPITQGDGGTRNQPARQRPSGTAEQASGAVGVRRPRVLALRETGEDDDWGSRRARVQPPQPQQAADRQDWVTRLDPRFLEPDGTVRCYACQGLGHTARFCPDEAARATNEERRRRNEERRRAEPASQAVGPVARSVPAAPVQGGLQHRQQAAGQGNGGRP